MKKNEEEMINKQEENDKVDKIKDNIIIGLLTVICILGITMVCFVAKNNSENSRKPQILVINNENPMARFDNNGIDRDFLVQIPNNGNVQKTK